MFDHKTNSKFINLVAIFIFLTLLINALQAGATLLIPFVLAIVFWYIVITLTDVYENLKWSKKQHWQIPHWLAKATAIGTVLLIIWLFVLIINSNIKQLIEALPAYQNKITILLEKLAQTWKIEQLNIENLVGNLNLSAFFSGLANGVGTILSYSGAILVYLIFLLLEYRQFNQKLDNLFVNKKQLHNLKNTLNRINADAQTYIKIQTLISFATGVLYYFVLLLFGVPFAIFWGMLAFVLNYIPVLGSVIATLLPLSFAVVELSSFSLVLGLGFLLIGIQVALGNIMLPRLMGKSLNLSPLVILLSLAFWGMVWGIPGMFLSVPIMVILNIALAQFESTRWLAVLFSGTGQID